MARYLGLVVFLSVLCQIMAQTTPSPGLSACDLPAVTGPCRANMERWHYDSATGRCHTFVYGGCQGNANNFFTQRDCEQFGRRCRHSPHNRPSPPSGWPPGTWSPKGQGVPRAIQLLPRDGHRHLVRQGTGYVIGDRGRWPGVPELY